MLALHRPVRIAGRTVVLLDDLALPARPAPAGLVAVPTGDAGLSLYADREQVAQLAAAHPQAALCGLWQTLHASGLLPETLPGCRVELDAPGQGRYLVREDGGARSGWTLDGAALDAYGADADACPQIKPDLVSLRLPAEPVALRRDGRTPREHARRALLRLLAPVAACLTLGIGADRMLAQRHAAAQARVQLETAQAQALSDRLDAWARIDSFDQTDRLDSLMHLARYPLPFEIPPTTLRPGAELSARLLGLGPIPPYPPPGLAPRRRIPQPDGSLRIVW